MCFKWAAATTTTRATRTARESSEQGRAQGKERVCRKRASVEMGRDETDDDSSNCCRCACVYLWLENLPKGVEELGEQQIKSELERQQAATGRARKMEWKTLHATHWKLERAHTRPRFQAIAVESHEIRGTFFPPPFSVLSLSVIVIPTKNPCLLFRKPTLPLASSTC